MHKLERLLNLTAALLDATRPLTADQIRERIEGYSGSESGFHRAFERDKDELRSMGIPISVETVPGTDPPQTGYRIHRKEYSGQAPNLTPDELAALYVASNLVRLQGVEHTEAFWKMGGVPEDAPAPSGSPPLVALPSEANLGPLFRAASELRVARFRYHGVDREVEPHRLSFSGGNWYLDAYDRRRQGQRLFRVDRIEGSVATGERSAFSRPPVDEQRPAVLRAWEIGDDEAVEARVLVDAEQSDWATRHLGRGSVVERRTDGSVVFALQVRNPPALRSFVLTFLDHAEILSPAPLRDDIVRWLEGLVA